MQFVSPTVARSVTGGVVLLLLGVLFIQFTGSLPTTDNDRGADRINLALRRTVHHLLRATGDSTSRIPPVQQVSAHTFEVQLQHAFDYDQLPDLLQESLRKYQVASSYDVFVQDCNRKELQLGYTASDLADNKSIPCVGRTMTAGCYVLRVTFEPQTALQQPLGLGWALALGGLITGMLVFVWHRSNRVGAAPIAPIVPIAAPVRFGNCSFDLGRQILTAGTTVHKLTYREAKLLGLLVNHPNQVLDRDTILKLVWEDEGVTVGRSIDVFVSRLRKVLRDDPTVRIVAIHGVGYKLEVDSGPLL